MPSIDWEKQSERDFCLEDKMLLHLVSDDAGREHVPLGEVQADAIPQAAMDPSERIQVAQARDGRWVLYREVASYREVRMFGRKRDLAEFLWGQVSEDTTCLLTLWQLDLIQISPTGYANAAP